MTIGSPRPAHVAAAACALLGAALGAGPVGASADRHPLRDATVTLLDPGGAVVSGGVTDEAGRYALRAAPGSYALRVRRIGSRTPPATTVVLTAGVVVRHDVALPAAPARLATMRAEARTTCAARSAPGADAARLWDEIGKALHATAVTERAGTARLTVRDVERELDPSTSAVRSERQLQRTGVAASPYDAPPAESLSAGGWVQRRGETTWFHAPTAATLASESFAADHCLSVTRDGAPAAGLIGLRFEPNRGRRLPDVRGTLWVDEATAELRRVDFAYTGLPGWARGVDLGGRVELGRVAGVGWIVRRWVVRAPRLGVVERAAAGGGALLGGRVATRREEAVVAIREVGGEVLEAAPARGRDPSLVAWDVGRGTVRGVVFDSVEGRPVAGARVEALGTGATATSGPDGGYEIAGLAAGRHTLTFSHPSVVGRVGPPRAVDVAAGSTSRADLHAPSAAAVARAICPLRAGARDTVAVHGTVRRAPSGAPAAGVPVAITWTHYARSGAERIEATPVTVRARSDSAGAYRVCGVPVGVAVRARTELPAGNAPAVTVVLRGPALARLDLRVTGTPE